MRRGVIAAVAAGFVVVVLIAWFALIAPQNKDISSTKAKVSSADKQTEQLQAELQHLQELSAKAPQQQAQLQKLNAAIPVTPALADFIEQANTLADQSGIDWLSITPGVPAASTSGGPTTIGLSIQLSGSFYQTLAYLDSLESLSRLVIIQNVSISAGSGGSTSSSGSSTSPSSGSATATTGQPQGELTVTLTGQMYTQATPPAANGTTTTPAPGGGTSTTTAPSGSSSTTAPSSSGSSAAGPVGRVGARGGRA
jgi:Tfp pilus assembly protein PilO